MRCRRCVRYGGGHVGVGSLMPRASAAESGAQTIIYTESPRTLCVISETDKGVYVLPKLIKTKLHVQSRFGQRWSRESKEINGYFHCPSLIGLPQGNSLPTPRSNMHRTASLPLGAW